MLFIHSRGGFFVRDRITAKRSDMSPAQTKIAAYVLEHLRDAAFLSAAELAERIGVSEATMIRFAAFLGYEGYTLFREAVGDALLQRLSTLERMKEYAPEEESSLFDRVVRDDLEAVAAIRTNTSESDVDALGRALAASGAVYIAGNRSSFALAYYFSFYLSWILPNVKLLSPDIPYETLFNAPHESLVVGISFPRYSSWTLRVLEDAKTLGLHTAAITDSPGSPLAMRSTYVVTVPYRPVSFIDSFAAPLSVINCLVLSVSSHLGEEAAEKLEALEEYWSRNRVYDGVVRPDAARRETGEPPRRC